jgi:hypothetical protein
MADIMELSALELLNLHADVLEELRTREIIRSSNNPVGDYTEHLCCQAFGWQQADNSEKDADAVGGDGMRYQIKGRRMTRHNGSRQLGALRRLPERNFDYLAGVLFNEDFTILRAALIPHASVLENAKYVEATNSWRFLLRDEVWNWPGVEDVSTKLQAAANR